MLRSYPEIQDMDSQREASLDFWHLRFFELKAYPGWAIGTKEVGLNPTSFVYETLMLWASFLKFIAFALSLLRGIMRI
jgi:hypothetical protein